jgi:hypothetical protein
MFSSANKIWKWHFRYWHQIWLDCEQQSENAKLVLLWLDFEQESNRKDTEDFLFFPTGIQAPWYDQCFRRYALSKLMNAAGILRWTDWRKLTISIFWPKFEMKYQETWIPNMEISFSDFWWIFVCLTPIKEQWLWPLEDSTRHNFWQKSGNRFGLWRWKKIWFVNGTTITNWTKRRMLCDHSRSGCMQKSERGTLKLRGFLGGNDQRQGKAGSKRYEGLKGLHWWRMLFGNDGGLGSLILWSI